MRPNKTKNTGRAAPWRHEPTLPRNIKTQSVESAVANKPKNETLPVLVCWSVLDGTPCSGSSSTSAIVEDEDRKIKEEKSVVCYMLKVTLSR